MTDWVSRLSNIPLPEPNLAGIAAATVLHKIRPWPLPGSRRAHRLAGLLFIAVGTGLIARSWAAAGRVNLARPGALVTTGPYSFSRNPMYAGWSLIQLGTGFAAGSAWTIVCLPAAARWLHHQVIREERELAEIFGEEFAQYRAAVPRYI